MTQSRARKQARGLASYPLLLLDPGYSVRRLFDAACRLPDVRPNILLESRAPHTLLALAEIGRGVAIIPSLQRTDRYALRIARVTPILPITHPTKTKEAAGQRQLVSRRSHRG